MLWETLHHAMFKMRASRKSNLPPDANATRRQIKEIFSEKSTRTEQKTRCTNLLGALRELWNFAVTFFKQTDYDVRILPKKEKLSPYVRSLGV